jgi:hypothetical protein
MVGNEPLDVLLPKAQHSAATTEAHARNTRLAPGGVITNPILRHSQNLSDFLE